MADEFDEDAPGAFDASDPKQVVAQKDKATRRRQRQLDALAKFLQSQGGREWYWDQLTRGHMFETSFTRGEPDVTQFKEGERNHALPMLADMIAAAPDAYLAMIKVKQ